ncbi:S8 family serine peptidase [Paracoccus liaowanqingii]|uniref:S8 family serine peptidase n=1 Tax=Paracoccus liaowanqingii TaxID=2560053 RepID=UPI00143DF207|nr:S8 family serine peptidase [Paracoccus liaowanqingii]
MVHALGTGSGTEALVFRPEGHALPQGIALADGAEVPSAMPVDPGTHTGIAIIDDGIGFLNARFRSDPVTSRFLGVWLQSAALKHGDSMGRVLNAVAVARLTAATATTAEAVLYRDLLNELHADPRLVRTILQAATHGTHVLDLAAGADPLDLANPMRRLPLIGVQLPPEAVNDTSGMQMTVPLLQGLRWAIMVAQTARLDRLIVNASLGILAGSKDGKSFLERQMARLIARAGRIGLEVHIVLPYGNDHEGRQVARLSAATGGHGAITLRLQPQDATPSYVEIRDLAAREAGDGAPLSIGLTLPDGTDIAAATVALGGSRDVLWRGRLVGRLYHRPRKAGRDAVVLLALAPTQAIAPGDATAPAGAWTIRFDDAGVHDIVLQVQRDDRAAGYRLSGRQAYFEAADAHSWNRRTRDWTGHDHPSCPIRHDGTNSAYATSPHPQIHNVGGALLTEGRAARPADYAARGADWSGIEPRLSAVSETSSAIRGLRASGTLSGTTARFSGSSAAAPTLTRALALNDPGGPVPVAAGDQDRLGAKALTANPAIR